MLKVLFADDEPLMLEGLRFLVDWEELDFEICGEALDGEDALQLIHSKEPDLVITDVRMPVIDGLELISRTYESSLRPKFIIFSGYADFEYAKRALKYGVANYLTKPLDEQELTEALQTVKAQIDLERRNSLRREALAALMQADTVARLLTRENTAEELADGLKTLGISPASRICCVLVHGTQPDSEKMRSRLASVDGNERLRGITAYPFTAGSRKHGYLLVSPPEGPVVDPAAVNRWIFEMRPLYDSPVQFTASRQHQGADWLNTAYHEALAAECCRKEEGGAAACFFQEPEKGRMARLPAELRSTLLAAVTGGEPEQLSTRIRDVFNLFAAEVASSAWIDGFLANIKAELLREIAARGGDSAAWAEKWFPPRYTAACLPHLERQTEEELAEAAGWFAAAAETGGGEDPMMSAVTGYVREHYQEKLKLQDIAKALHVNSAYLGQRFRKHYGSSFNDYLHEFRIEEAKKLLRRTDMGISDIASRVGYSDADVFAAKFKALNGVTPSGYKKS